MKRKIKITDFDGKTKIIEKELPSKDHLAAQIKYPARIQKSKKTYTRKIKHKKNMLDSFFIM